MKHLAPVRRILDWLNAGNRMYWLLGIGLTLSVAFTFFQRNARLVCSAGIERCVATQGRLLPIAHAMELAEQCTKFTNDNLGLKMLGMYQSDIAEESQVHRKRGNGPSPLYLSAYAYDQLYESSLPFDRDAKAPEVKYQSLRDSCSYLRRDLEFELSEVR